MLLIFDFFVQIYNLQLKIQIRLHTNILVDINIGFYASFWGHVGVEGTFEFSVEFYYLTVGVLN